ncbi:MAG: succinate dehydrogenase, cytochrome b556 subunit [Pseudomonadota bacterium]|nr:succinate dehydrogenase, cytochrome b556 subunit [Pseudomonadota bacterium]
MTNSKRPLSPHLQIYKPQLTSILSISHRITGAALSLFSIIIPAIIFSISLGEETYNEFKTILNHSLFKIFLVLVIFSLAYHLANGIRHIFWDFGLGLELKESYLSGYLVVVFSVIVTSILIFSFY